jgi:glycosyltransferase involved in cell wall biosynthesis
MTSVLVDARLSWASGIGRYVANTLPLVATELPEVAFELLVTPANMDRAYIACAGVPNIKITEIALEAFTLAEQWRLNGLAKGHDLTWFTNYWVPLTFRRPFVATIHDMLHLEPGLFPASLPKRMLSRITFAHVARRALGILYVSRFTRREFERRFRGSRATVVSHLGIDHKDWGLFDPAQSMRKERRILLVAAPKKHKNFEIAVSAFALAELGPGWTLTLVLPQKDLRSSIDVSALAHARGDIEIQTAISNEELRALYEKSAILLMPSLYEGFGLPLAEGLQAGAICISSTAESLVELGQGANVTWVNPLDLDGWVKAIEDSSQRWDTNTIDRAVLADNMRHAAAFRWADVANATVSLLRPLLLA